MPLTLLLEFSQAGFLMSLLANVLLAGECIESQPVIKLLPGNEAAVNRPEDESCSFPCSISDRLCLSAYLNNTLFSSDIKSE